MQWRNALSHILDLLIFFILYSLLYLSLSIKVLHKIIFCLCSMRITSVKNTLFLKDLFDSSTIEEFVENSYYKDREEVKTENPLTIYSPKFIRGVGAQREGHCQTCDRWFKMKTSSYWYHMNYKHGINSKGIKYPDPVLREINYKIEGFCNICDQWITLGNKHKTSRFLWKKHFQKEHSVHTAK